MIHLTPWDHNWPWGFGEDALKKTRIASYGSQFYTSQIISK